MNAGPDKITAHAETIRARLGEIHETLKVDFPVYVMFTWVADLGSRDSASISVLRGGAAEEGLGGDVPD